MSVAKVICHMLFMCTEWLGDWRGKCNSSEGDLWDFSVMTSV